MITKKACGAKNRAGLPCRRSPMPNGRCHLHGGKSPGAKPGNQNALKHGAYTAEAVAFRRMVRASLKEAQVAQSAAMERIRDT